MADDISIYRNIRERNMTQIGLKKSKMLKSIDVTSKAANTLSLFEVDNKFNKKRNSKKFKAFSYMMTPKLHVDESFVGSTLEQQNSAELSYLPNLDVEDCVIMNQEKKP